MPELASIESAMALRQSFFSAVLRRFICRDAFFARSANAVISSVKLIEEKFTLSVGIEKVSFR